MERRKQDLWERKGRWEKTGGLKPPSAPSFSKPAPVSKKTKLPEVTTGPGPRKVFSLGGGAKKSPDFAAVTESAKQRTKESILKKYGVSTSTPGGGGDMTSTGSADRTKDSILKKYGVKTDPTPKSWSPSTLTTGGRKPVSASSYQSLFPKGKAPERPAVPQARIEADRREAGALESRLRLGEATEEDFTGYLEDVRGTYNYTPEPGSWEEMLQMTQSYLRSLEPRAETFADRRAEGRDLLSRLANTVTGAAKEYAGSMASAASTLYQSNYKNTVDHLLNGGVDPELEGLVDPEEYARRIQEHSRRAIEKMNGWAEDVTQSGAADIAKAREGLNPAGKLAVDLGVAVTQMAGDGTVGMVTGGGGMLPLLVRSFGGGAYEARQKGYSEEEQVALGLARAATEYFTERLFGGNPVYDRDAGLVNKLVEKVTGDSRLLAVLTSPFFDKVEEGLEEVVGNVLDPMAEWVITGNWEGYDLDRIVEEGVIGILAAMIAKGGARVMNGAKGRVGEALNVQGDAAAEQPSPIGDQALNELMHDRGFLSYLERKGDLKLTKDMTQDQKRTAIREAMERSVQKEPASTKETEDIHYSLKAFADGRRFVEVDTDQAQFDGLSFKQLGYQARKVIKEKFKGKVIGIENRAFVNGNTAEEYGHPIKKLSPQEHEAKMRASTELDNLLDAGTNFRTEADGRDGHIHPGIVGDFQYFDTIFKVGDEFYKGVINIKPTSKGLLLKDITKIENITQDISSSYGQNPKSTFLRDVSMDSIRQNTQKDNREVPTEAEVKPESRPFATEKGTEAGLVWDQYVEKRLRPETADRINIIARELGMRVRFVDSVRGGRANAGIQGSEIRIERYNPNPATYLLGHELTHRLQETAPEAYARFREAVRSEAEKEARGLYELYRGEGIEMDYAGALDEATANCAGRLLQDGRVLEEFIERHRTDRSMLEKLLEAIRGLISKLTGEEKRKAQTAEGKLLAALEEGRRQAKTAEGQGSAVLESGEARYSINEAFREEVAAWDWAGRPEGEWFTLGSTGPVMQGLGAIESDIFMEGDKIGKILYDHPEMTIREIQRIPEILEDPVLVVKSRGGNRRGQNSRLVIFGSVKAQNGQPIMTVFDLRPVDGYFVLDDMQKVNSSYARSNALNYVQGGEILHADEKRTASLLRSIGLHGPIELQQSGSIGSISYYQRSVNVKGVPFFDVVKVGE